MITYKIVNSTDLLTLDVELRLAPSNIYGVLLQGRNPGAPWHNIARFTADGKLALFEDATAIKGLETTSKGKIIVRDR